MDSDIDALRQALRRLPVPEPRPEFVDRAIATSVGAANTGSAMRATAPGGLRRFLASWQLWIGAVLGGAVATVVTVMLLRPVGLTPAEAPQLALALNEARNIDVLIDSERDLDDASIRIIVSGSIALDGFDSEREIGWRANLERGSNLLSLPVVARSPGAGKLVAVIEHGGRTRRVTIDLTVSGTEISQS